MSKKKDYSAVWVDSTIHDFLVDIEMPPTSMKYALITCLDSCTDVRSMAHKSPDLSALGSQIQFVGKGALVSTRRLLTAERKQRIFFGFDEVWFFPQPPVKPKSNRICLTGPTELTDQFPPGLAEWMKKTNCSVGLGDGTGLNIVAKLRGIAKYVLNHWSVSTQTSSVS